MTLSHESASQLGYPPSKINEHWLSPIDVLRGESILSDLPPESGTLGYRSLRYVTTPIDRPPKEVKAPTIQLMHDLYSVCSFLSFFICITHFFHICG